MSKSFPSIEELFQQVIQILKEQKTQFAVAGGIAVSLYRRQKRTTEDLDFLILSGENTQSIAETIIHTFGLIAGVARKADLEGGPLFAIKKKSTPPMMVIGRDPKHPERVGLDFLLPTFPWFGSAISRAQDNEIDYGFGPIPTLTLEDIIIAKVYAVQNDQRRFKDLDDLQSIFKNKQPMDFAYLSKEMNILGMVLPNSILKQAPEELQKISHAVRRGR